MITQSEIIDALELIQRELDKKLHGGAGESCIVIRPTNSERTADASDEDSVIIATGHNEIADWLLS